MGRLSPPLRKKKSTPTKRKKSTPTRQAKQPRPTRQGGGPANSLPKWKAIGSDGNRALEVFLKDGETIVADGGAMAYMDGAIRLETKMGGIGKALGRMLSGEDLFLNRYTGTGQAGEGQRIVFSVPLPGDMTSIDIPAGQSWKLSRGTFLVGTGNVDVSAKLNARGILSVGQEEGLVLTKVTAPDNQSATVWVAAYGLIEHHRVPSGSSLLVDNENFLACSVDVNYEISRVGGFKSLVFSGEGLAMRFTGPCELYTQSKGVQGLARELAAYLPAK